jgi:hypothetical protein
MKITLEERLQDVIDIHFTPAEMRAAMKDETVFDDIQLLGRFTDDEMKLLFPNYSKNR